MARNKKKIDNWDGDGVDNLLDSLFDRAKQFYGEDGVFTGSEAEQRIVGLRLPALSAMYLFQSTVFPLSRMAQLVGTEASGKSTLLYEIFRWFRSFNGRSLLLENETKDSPELRNSILDYDYKAVLTRPCEFLEDWQEGLINFVAWAKEVLEGTPAKPGPGRIRPLCCGIDSLTAKACRETDKKISELGYAERSYPVEANLISTFMKVMPQKLEGWPLAIVGVNHLKPGQDKQGRPTKNIPGGRSLKFQETYEIELTRIAEINKKNFSGYTVKMFTKKNGLGADRKSIMVDIIRWYEKDPRNGELKLRTIFNWEAASISLLLDFQKNKDLWNEINQFLDLHPVRTKGLRVWSDALSIPSSSPVTYREAGQILEKHPKILEELYKLLCIRKRWEFQPGEDYRDQQKKAAETAYDYDSSEGGIDFSRANFEGNGHASIEENGGVGEELPTNIEDGSYSD